MGTSALNLEVTADVEQLQKALDNDATQSVENFADTANEALSKAAGSTNKYDKAVTATMAHTTSEMVRAEGAWLLFDRTFRLGMDREMMTILQAFPVLRRFLAVLGSTPATLGILIAFAFLRRAIESLVKDYKEAEQAQGLFHEAMAKSSLTIESQTQALIVQNDSLDNQIARIEHRPENNLKIAIDRDTESMLRLASTTEQAMDQLDAAMDDGKMHIGFMGAAVTDFVNELKYGMDAGIDMVGVLFAGMTGQLDNYKSQTKSFKFVAPDKDEAKQVSDLTGQIKELGAEYAVMQAQAGDDPVKKRAADNLYATKLNVAYTDSIHKLGVAYDDLKKQAADHSSVDFSKPMDTLLEGQRRLIIEQSRFNHQRQVDDKSTTELLKQQDEDALNRANALSESQISASKTVASAQLGLKEATAKREFTLGQTSIQQQTQALQDAENERYKNQTDALQKSLALAQREPGDQGAAKQTSLKSQIQAAELEHQQKLLEIKTSGDEQQRAQDEALGRTQVLAIHEANAARIAGEEEGIRFRVAMHHETDEQQTQDEVNEENKRYANDVKAKQAEITLLQQNGEKSKDQVAALQSELQSMEVTHQNKLTQIRDSAEEKDEQRREALLTQNLNEQEELNNKTLQIANEREQFLRSSGAEAPNTAIARQIEALNKWYAAETKIRDQQILQAARMYQKDDVQYQAALNKKKLLDIQYQQSLTRLQQQEEQQWMKFFGVVTSQFNQNFDQWMNKQVTFGRSMEQMWNGIVESAANAVLKMAEQQLIGLLLQKGMQKQSILGSAKTAAANTYSSVSDIPVVGPFLAPPAAAAAFAAVMAFDSFDKGGIVRANGSGYGMGVPILAHPGERVLSSSQTNNFENLVNQSQTKGGDNHYHYSPQISGIDGASVASMARSHGQTFFREAYRQARLKNKI